MITILYSILIYLLFGALIYLIAQHQNDEEMTLFKQELFLLLGWIWKPIIIVILLMDGKFIPYLKFKHAIRYIKYEYDYKLINPYLSEEDKQKIVAKRDKLIDFITNIYKSEPEEDEE